MKTEKKWIRLIVFLVLVLLPSATRAEVVAEYLFDDPNPLYDTAAGGAVNDDLEPVLAGPAVTYEAGVVGKAVRTGDASGATYLFAYDSEDLDLPGGQYTIEAFIKPDLPPDPKKRIVVGKWQTDYAYLLHFNRANIGISHNQADYTGTDGIVSAGFTSPASAQRWHHVAATADGTNITVWLDGEQVGTVAYDGTIRSGADNFSVGSFAAKPSWCFCGLIDEVKVHNVAYDQAYMQERTALIAAHEVSNISPAIGANDVETTAVLTWDPPTAVSNPNYIVYLSTDPAFPDGPVSYGQTETSYDPDPDLDSATTYYWAVDVNDAGTIWLSPYYSFTTTFGEADSLVVEYKFDDPNNFDDTSTGGEVSDTLTPNLAAGATVVNYEYGILGQAVRTGDFAGALSLSALDSNDLDLMQYTIEAFIKPDALVPNPQFLVSKWSSGKSFDFRLDGSRVLLYHNQAGAAGYALAESDPVVVLHEWQHVAATADGTNITVWLDGEPVGTALYDGTTMISTDDLSIGARASDGQYPFLGLIDEVRLHKVAKDQTYMQERVALPRCVNPPAGDLNGDCLVTFEDFAILGETWLECGLEPMTACP
ncbi:MAG: LamG domain-containing protein [Planctomycetota bacterium]|jgi:hypothetical protein